MYHANVKELLFSLVFDMEVTAQAPVFSDRVAISIWFKSVLSHFNLLPNMIRTVKLRFYVCVYASLLT